MSEATRGAPVLRALGTAGSYPARGRACSSYLVEVGDHRLLLDCGNGSLANLQRFCSPGEVDAVVISHGHHDHLADLVGLYQHLRFGHARRTPELLGPAEALAVLEGMVADYGEERRPWRTRAVVPGDDAEVGPLRLGFFPTWHSAPGVATRVEAGGAALAYTGDSDWTDGLVDAADGVNALLSEATWRDREGKPAGVHLSGRQAGELAAAAGAGELLVTHVWPEEDPAAVAADAAAAFGGPTRALADAETVTIGGQR